MNIQILIGNVGRDPELSYTTAGVAKCRFSMATTERWTDKATNEKKETTVWHNIVLWRRQAEIAKEFLVKGSKVAVVGKTENRQYEKDGVKKSITEVIASSIELLSGRSDAGDDSQKQEAVPSHFETDDDLPF